MDQRLLSWGLSRRSHLPRLWLFTDSLRLPDPRPAITRLPRGCAGVVFRHDDSPDRWQLGHDIARICRDRRLVLVVAGDARLAARLHAGMHLRSGRYPSALRPQRTKGGTINRSSCNITTSSAHSVADLQRASRNGVALAFLSPAFPTASHPGAPSLGACRWSAWARQVSGQMAVAALGGVDGRSIRRLDARICVAAGAIGALGWLDSYPKV